MSFTAVSVENLTLHAAVATREVIAFPETETMRAVPVSDTCVSLLWADVTGLPRDCCRTRPAVEKSLRDDGELGSMNTPGIGAGPDQGGCRVNGRLLAGVNGVQLDDERPEPRRYALVQVLKSIALQRPTRL